MASKQEFLINADDCQVYIVRSMYTFTKQDVDEITRIPFQQESIMMVGKLIPQPRRVYFCSDPDVSKHAYSGVEFPTQEWLPVAKRIRDAITDLGISGLNSCLINEYADGSRYIGYHSDKETAIGKPIVTVSYGGSRDFYFKPILESGKLGTDTIKTVLHHGDMVVMSGQTQKRYKHSIPKRANADPRISFTYRCL